jgi:hypothetical protein
MRDAGGGPKHPVLAIIGWGFGQASTNLANLPRGRLIAKKFVVIVWGPAKLGNGIE